MEIPYICCFPCVLLENTGNHLALWMCNWNRLRRFCSPSFCFFTFQKRYFQIRIRNLNPKMSTLTWTNLKVCSYDTKNYASGCVTWSIEDISRIDEVCYTWLYQIPTFFFNSIATARLKTPLGIMQIFPRFQNKSLIATFSVARIHSSVGPNDFRTSWVS